MRRIVPVLVAIAAAAPVVVAVSGGDDKYTVKMRLANAGGLRNGSTVINGGIPIGTVALHAHRDDVEVELNIDRKYAPIGRDATAGIVAQNLLGQKQVRVEPGTRSDPAPDGYVLPGRQVRETTDLDQLLNALDPDTRTRLAIVVNEMGTAFAGRKIDFSTFLRDFAPALSSTGRVLDELAADNHALTNLVGTSDRFVAELTRQRRHFAHVIASAGSVAETVATKREQLRATLRRAPSALRQARRFLAELRGTAAPLGQTARLVRRTAPSLTGLLDQVGPFERDTGPTIRAAASLGPIARRTGTRSARTIARLVATAAALRSVSQTEIPPVGKILDRSADNLLATVDNWAHAIQFRDGLGHIFRGEASVAPDLWDSVVNRLIPPSVREKLREGDRERKRAAKADPAPKAAAPAQPEKPKRLLPDIPLPPKVDKVVDEVLSSVEKLLPSASGGASNGGDGPSALLDYLLGDGK